MSTDQTAKLAKRRGLGRGLDALLGVLPQTTPVATTPATTAPAATAPPGAEPVPTRSTDGDLRQLPVDVIQRGRYQPRVDMHTDSLQELAASIKAQGVVQPIVVRPLATPGRYEIIAGERRWRASQLAGLHEIPALIKDVPDEAALAMALIENIQREGLNPLEEAVALHRLAAEFQLTHQEVADAVGRSRVAVSNLLRLLDLQDDVKKLLENGDLEMGHARALLSLPATLQSEAARRVVAKGLSVRETEQLVRHLLKAPAPNRAAQRAEDPNIKRFIQELSDRLGANVEIHHGSKGKGSLTIHYHSLEELEGILAHIK